MVTTCRNCESHRLVSIDAHCSDSFNMQMVNEPDKEIDGYVPLGIGINEDGAGDDVQLTYCLECGQIHGIFPISVEAENEAFEIEPEDETNGTTCGNECACKKPLTNVELQKKYDEISKKK